MVTTSIWDGCLSQLQLCISGCNSYHDRRSHTDCPSVQVYGADHPLDPALRKGDLENGRPVRIGANVWIRGGAIILPGVTIGDDAVIGAGSIVTRDVPAGAKTVGNPARIKG
jgi:maltose O-acetyltransferase